MFRSTETDLAVPIVERVDVRAQLGAHVMDVLGLGQAAATLDHPSAHVQGASLIQLPVYGYTWNVHNYYVHIVQLELD